MGLGMLSRNIYNIFQFVVGSKKFVRITNKARERIRGNWGEITQNDIAEKFFKLTKGLDEKSVSLITQILARQKAILTSNKQFLDLFTAVEQQELRELKDNFYNRILQISDDIFVYKKYLLPIDYHYASVLYYKHGIDKVETIADVKGKAIIDAGGYIGDSVLVFEELEPDRIYTFEPSPDNFELMKRTIELNGLKNVIAENVALGAEKGEATLYMDAWEGSATGIVNRGFVYRKEIKVPVISLDDYVAKHKIENIGLIKADIEGAEPMFLAGAKKTICAQKPILMICIYHNAHDFFEIKPLIESWNLGYKFKIYKPTFENVVEETILIAEIL